ncbi:hypothetical protein E1165_17560 [Micromonospora sp. KC723]|nr:MmpS family transport accessory protein [Micromonospora sp. KC723]TDB73320.1 hypothetical protein E1165_17560 [Micromonospora sp. KC723]
MPDPTASPAPPQPWAPPDPLTAPQPWAAPGSADATPTAPTGYGPTGGVHGTPAAPYGPSGGALPGPGTPPVGWPPPGYPPPGYPPPYAHPGRPPVHVHPGYQPVGGSATSGRWVVGIVAAALAVLVLGFCGCLGAGNALLGWYAPEPVAEDPYDGYDDGEEDEDPTWTPPALSQPATPATTPSGGPGRYPVSYEVTGTGRADIQYYDANGDFIRLEGVRLPWRERIRTDDPNRVVVIAGGDDTGPIRCSAQVGGRTPVTEAGEPGARVTCQPS